MEGHFGSLEGPVFMGMSSIKILINN